MSDPNGVAGNTWAAYLRQARNAKGMSIDDLAAEADVSRMTIIRWEQGRPGFKHETITRVASALGINPAEAMALASGDVDANPPPPLPTEIGRLVDAYSAMRPADRTKLLERVEWVAEWAEAVIRTYDQRPERGRRQTG